MKKSELKVGALIILKPVNDLGINCHKFESATISKIGSQFFYAIKIGRKTQLKFFISDGKESTLSYRGSYKAYLTKSDIVNEEESNILHQDIRHYFEGIEASLSLDKLRKILKVIQEGQS